MRCWQSASRPLKMLPPKLFGCLRLTTKLTVAAPVLEKSERLGDDTLVERECQRKKARGIYSQFRDGRHTEARRSPMCLWCAETSRLCRALQKTAVWRRFSDAGFAILVRRSDGDDRLAEYVGMRPEIPKHLFLSAARESFHSVRRKLRATHPRARTRFVKSSLKSQIGFRGESPRQVAEYFGGNGRPLNRCAAPVGSTTTGLHEIAKRGRFEEVTAALALMSELPVSFVERAMTQGDRGDDPYYRQGDRGSHQLTVKANPVGPLTQMAQYGFSTLPNVARASGNLYLERHRKLSATTECRGGLIRSGLIDHKRAG